ncbi:hypothetical protein C8R43DRAFT_1118754 [Mycena crocata]|nr:hypothetical protein C8R43DRAFT_1118754 [Mycena crocata]
MLSLLPQELVDLILREMNRETLCACALLCSSLSFSSQRLIFRSIVIHCADIPKLDSLLRGSPHFSRHVRDVELILHVHHSIPNSSVGVIQSLFHTLERLTLRGGGTAWNNLPSELRSSIQDLLLSTNFGSLNLSHLYAVPPTIITGALSCVRSLGMYNISLDGDEDAANKLQIRGRPFVPLTKRLILHTTVPGNVCPILDLVLKESPSPCLDDIQELAVTFNGDTRRSSLRLITAIAGSLRYLHVSCGEFYASFDLPCLPVLHTLKIKMFLGHLSPTLHTALTKLPVVTPSIEVLELVFCHSSPAAWIHHPWIPWSKLFADYPASLPELRRVCCRITSAVPPVQYAHFVAYVRQTLPSLRDTGILRFSQSLDDETDVLFP